LFTKKSKKILSLAIASLLSIDCFAIDLGVKGRVYNVDEVDIRIVIMQMIAEKVDIEEHKKEMVKKADEFYRNLPRHELLLSKKKEVTYIDPTKVYEDDYWSLDENNKWIKLVKAGDEVNWLEHNPSPMPVFFIFDYQSSIQRELASYIVKLRVPFLKVIFIGGDIKGANDKLGYPLTYLNQTVIDEYDIKYVPLVIKRGRGEFKNLYKKIRFNLDEVTVEEVIAEIQGKE